MKIDKMCSVYVMLGLVLIMELGYLFYNSSIVAGLNLRADKLKIYSNAVNEDESIVPGDILDRNGITLASTEKCIVSRETEDGQQVEKTAKITEYKDGMAYSQLLGYTGRRVYNPLAGAVEEVVGARNDARLMAFLDEDYWGENGLYKTTGEEGTKGQSAVLTIDSDLQETVCGILSNYMSSSENIGSAVVMDAKTGEILADVCFPTYDFNNLSIAQKAMNVDSETTNLEPGYPVTYKNAIAPGSIFKMLMAVALIDNDMADYQVSNDAYRVNDSWTCKNMYYSSNAIKLGTGDMIDLETALNVSSNVYFAKAAVELGSEKVNEIAEKFMMKSEENGLLLDFGKVKYNWNTDVSDDVLAQTGFGQGLTEWTTIYAAMVTQAIANDGEMMKPYMVKNLVDEKGNKVYTGKAQKLSQATSEKTANLMTEYLRSTAKESCSFHGLSKTGEVFEKYQVAGKTGTAENGDEQDTNNAWYVSFAPADNPEYVVVVNQAKTSKYGYQIMPAVADIYSYLFEEYK